MAIKNRAGTGKLTAEKHVLERCLELLNAKPEGWLQSELRTELGIDSALCSRILIKLERSGFVTRDRICTKGFRTYLVKRSRSTASVTHNLDTYLAEFYVHFLAVSADHKCKVPCKRDAIRSQHGPKLEIDKSIRSKTTIVIM